MSSGGGGKKRGPMRKMAHVGPNMTPMVDVVMCILIFFMLGSSFVMPELFLKSSMPAIDKAGLGEKAAEGKMPAVKLWIKLANKGDETSVAAFDWAPMQLRRLKTAPRGAADSEVTDIDKENEVIKGEYKRIVELFDKKSQTLSPDVQIIIKPAADVPYQDVITIYDACMAAKFKQVAFAPAG